MKALQERTARWVIATHGEPVFTNRRERALRVLEEAIELAQAEGLWGDDVERLKNRVYHRPVGEPAQEGAGTIVTLLAWAESAGFDLTTLAEAELTRIEAPEMMVKIRQKQVQKALAGTGMRPTAVTEPVPVTEPRTMWSDYYDEQLAKHEADAARAALPEVTVTQQPDATVCDGKTSVKIYVDSRTRYAALWQNLRAEGFPIVSSWIDEAGAGQTTDMGLLWKRIGEEVRSADAVLLYADVNDTPLKGALVEAGGAAVLLEKLVTVVTTRMTSAAVKDKLGSWVAHPLVSLMCGDITGNNVGTHTEFIRKALLHAGRNSHILVNNRIVRTSYENNQLTGLDIRRAAARHGIGREGDVLEIELRPEEKPAGAIGPMCQVVRDEALVPLYTGRQFFLIPPRDRS